ncbi:MAG: hypothetical protein ACRD0U_03665 [Acidimicrobiales bacterium]
MSDFTVHRLPLPHVHIFGHPEGYFAIHCGPTEIAIVIGRENARRIARLVEKHGLLLEIAAAPTELAAQAAGQPELSDTDGDAA